MPRLAISLLALMLSTAASAAGTRMALPGRMTADYNFDARRFYALSPYVYCGANPILLFIPPTGIRLQ